MLDVHHPLFFDVLIKVRRWEFYWFCRRLILQSCRKSHMGQGSRGGVEAHAAAVIAVSTTCRVLWSSRWIWVTMRGWASRHVGLRFVGSRVLLKNHEWSSESEGPNIDLIFVHWPSKWLASARAVDEKSKKHGVESTLGYAKSSDSHSHAVSDIFLNFLFGTESPNKKRHRIQSYCFKRF